MLKELENFLLSLPEANLMEGEMLHVSGGDAPAQPMELAYCGNGNEKCGGNVYCPNDVCGGHVLCISHNKCGTNHTQCFLHDEDICGLL